MVLAVGSTKGGWGFPQALPGGRAPARGWFCLLSSVLMPSREGNPRFRSSPWLQALTSTSRPLVGQLLPRGGWDWRQRGALGNPGNHVLPEVAAEEAWKAETHFAGFLFTYKSKAKSRYII